MENPRNRIIVMAEFTEASRLLLQLARDIAAPKNLPVVVVHQPLGPVPVVTESEMTGQIKKEEAQHALGELEKFAGPIFIPKTNVVYKVSREHLAEQVHRLQDEDIKDFIITGSRPKEWPERLLIGSTAVSLVDHTDQITMVVPEGQSGAITNSICVSLSAKFAFNYEAFERLLSVAPNIQKIHLITVVTDEEEQMSATDYLERIQKNYKNNYSTSITVLKSEEPWLMVEDFLSSNPGLLVLQRGSRNLADTFRRFFINRFIYAARRPLVVLP